MLMAARDRDNGEPMSDKELIDEVLTLIVAGHETTAAALTWTWYLISQHPDTAARLQAEADRTPDAALGPRRRGVARIHASGASRRRCGCIRRDGCSRGARSRR